MKISSIDLKKANDTGQALVLLCLIIFLFTLYHAFVVTGLIILLVNMVCPIVFKPVAVLWFGLAEILGTVVSRIVLTLVFVLLVIPVGLLRYYAGSDPMRLKEWKQSPSLPKCQKEDEEAGWGHSVFVERNHLYTSQDLVNPY
ncbi:MAG: hypothetical protein LBE12_02105 [Planctomycetaceae bacterium]|nr:hypothetical protein [Planctomycetaceae bacterium]